MDIPKTYLKQSQLYLNSSIMMLIPAILFTALFLFVLYDRPLIILVLPFLIYSFCLYQGFLINKNRYFKTANYEGKASDGFLDCQQYLLFFDKEEGELLFFHPSGEVIAKMIEIKPKRRGPREICLIGHNEQVLASYFISTGHIDVYVAGMGFIGSFYRNKEKDKWLFQVLTGEVTGHLVRNRWYMDEQIIDKYGRMILRCRRGVMATNLQAHFQNPNLPIVKNEINVDPSEKLFYLSTLAKRYFGA
jgi:hypothetical protein